MRPIGDHGRIGSLLAQTLPLALGAAVSPIVVVITVAMLTGEGRARRALAFLGGEAVVLLGIAAVVVAGGSAVSFELAPTTMAIVDLVFAVLLLAVGTRALLRARASGNAAREEPASPSTQHADVAPRRAFEIGIGSMATNFTSLVLYLPALKSIAASDLPSAERLLVLALVIVVVLSTVWLPLLLTRIAPATAEALLTRIASGFQHNEQRLTIVLGLGFGTYLLVRGLSGV